MTNTYDMLLTPPSVRPIKAEDAAEVPSVKVQSTKKRGKEALPRRQEAVVSSNQDPMPPRHHDTMPPSVVETIRKSVKQVGKEAATHRFTAEEKRAIANIVYTYGRQGYKTSENEITRLAVNWLMLDYQEKEKQSVLSRLLEALHE